jgi:hypothetical protein
MATSLVTWQAIRLLVNCLAASCSKCTACRLQLLRFGTLLIFTNLHLERYVPDMVQTKRYQATLDETVDTERHNRVLDGRRSDCW